MLDGRRVFIAAPMSGFSSDDDYRTNRGAVLRLVEHLRARHRVASIYYAGTEIGSTREFSEHALALETDLAALRKADVFVLIYPRKVVSSALIEAGCALERRLPMLVLVRDLADLPYLFRDARKLSRRPNESAVPPIAIATYEREEAILDAFERALADLGQVGSAERVAAGSH